MSQLLALISLLILGVAVSPGESQCPATENALTYYTQQKDFSASSSAANSQPFDARPYTTATGWTPKGTTGEWLQIDLNCQCYIGTIIISSPSSAAWVSEYTFRYSRNGRTWTVYQETLYGPGPSKIYPARARFIRIYPKAWVTKILLQVEICGVDPNAPPVPVNGNYSEWSEYNVCSATCGSGKQQRSRTCTNPSPRHGGKNCFTLGPSLMSRQCNTQECPVDGNYTEWSEYNVCSATCGGGKQQRNRTCINPSPQHGGKNCSTLGPSLMSRQCNTQECPVDGNYTEWSEYNVCSATCGGGKQQRNRTCINPSPQHGGKNCSTLGPSRMSRQCNTQECPVDGNYSEWSEFNVCSATCGGGEQYRTRTCTNPSPEHGGMNCSTLGPSRMSRECNTQECEGSGEAMEPNVIVQCNNGTMTVDVPIAMARFDENVALIDPNCRAVLFTNGNGTEYLRVSTGLKNCNTTRNVTGDLITYSNRVIIKSRVPGQVITRQKLHEISVHCTFSPDISQTSVAIEPDQTTLIISANATGVIPLHLDMYPNENYFQSEMISDVHSYKVHLGERLYAEIRVDFVDRNVWMKAERCFATPLSSADSHPSYDLISNFCPVDETMILGNRTDPHVERFSFNAFRILESHQFVYIHCTVKLCNGFTWPCTETCQQQPPLVMQKREDHATTGYKVSGKIPLAVHHTT